MILKFVAVTACTSLFAFGGLRAANAQSSPTPTPATVSCDRAAAMMSHMMQTRTAAKPLSTDATVDDTFVAMAKDEAKMFAAMSKLEMRCGKSEKVKASVSKMLPDLARLEQTLMIF